MSKKCKRCLANKPLDSFPLHKSARDGHRRICKDCSLVNKGRPVNFTKEEIKRNYYERNRELCLHRSKKWREENREQYNQWCRDNKDKLRARGYALKAKYGITLDQYDELLERQNGCCAICQKHYTEFKTLLAVDHSHRTNRVRGLLCTYCNHRLVGRHEDGDLLRRIADYIEQGTEWFAPEKKKRRRKTPRKVRQVEETSDIDT